MLPSSTSTEPNTFKIPADIPGRVGVDLAGDERDPLIRVDTAGMAGGAIGPVGAVARNGRVIERHCTARINPPAVSLGTEPRTVHLRGRVSDHVDVCQCQHVPRVVDEDRSAVSVAHVPAGQGQRCWLRSAR